MIHLRIRTEYTFKQVYGPIQKCVDRLKSVQVTHAAIVDLDGTWGHVWWHEACQKACIVPILGVELVVSEIDDHVPKMFFLARNADGLRELYNFTSKAYRQTIKTARGHKPRLYKTDVKKMSKNIYIFAGDILEEEFLLDCDAILDINPASRVLNSAKIELAKKHHMRLVSTADNWFPSPEDSENFELIEGRKKPSKQYILEANEMLDSPSIGDLSFENYPLTKAPNLHKDGDLENLCREGAKFRSERNGLVWSEAYEKRLRREVDLILTKKFESYFFIVSDIVKYAKTKMLVGPSRGSSAGSLVCYLLRITEIDPVEAKLYFERFIDESRKDLPDIDIDFPGLKRHIIAEYMEKEYTNVAHIGTVSRYKSKSALDKACETLGIPLYATFACKAAIIQRTSGDARGSDSLVETLDTTKAGSELLEQYPELRRACELENHASHTSTHAAGLLVCNEPIENFCTVQADGTAQVEKKTVEALNLLKIDALGLRTLDILEDCGVENNWYEMKFDDPKTYDIFNRQALSGIFQFEGQSMRNLSSQIEFKSLHDIDAVVALARPGPFGGGVTAEWLERRKGKEYRTFHPLVEEHMKDTYGLPVYQEQTMAIVREIGKFDWNKVSSIRKAVALKKGKDFFDQYFDYFLEGALEQGMTKEEARAAWEYINSMGAYQMNKAHTYSYAVLSYWCAWLKAHHPYEFAASNMRHSKDEESSITMLQEMIREGLKYSPFNLEKSQKTWSVKGGELIAGFDSLYGFGEVNAKKFAEMRDAGLLTEAQKGKAISAPSMFKDLFPIHTKFRVYYEDHKNVVRPNGMVGLMNAPVDMKDIVDGSSGSFCFIGRLIQKNLKDDNEAVNVKKRGGKLREGPVIYLHVRLADDTDRVQVRIDRFDYPKYGKEIFECPLNTYLLVRAMFSPRTGRFGFVQGIEILEKPIEREKQVTVNLPKPGVPKNHRPGSEKQKIMDFELPIAKDKFKAFRLDE